MTYLYDLPGWPHFTWNETSLSATLAAVRHQQGRLLGRMEGLGLAERDEASLQALTKEALKSSEIEGEVLRGDLVRSSIARRLGLDAGGLTPADRRVEGLADMVVDATREFAAPLTQERLFTWHRSLFAGGHGPYPIRIGAWRDDSKGPMQVVSGQLGAEKVHYEAPPASRLEKEMADFIAWENGRDALDPVLKAAIAHLWFVTVHPFDDGNGRIARAIADRALARSEGSTRRFYSMSAQIREERTAYYDVLELTQKDSLDITDWLKWFLDCLGRALEGSAGQLASVLAKERFWKTHAGLPLNARQRLMLNKLLDGFEGKLTTTKWSKLADCSQDTAHRDIVDLIEKGALLQDAAGGRSTSYSLRQV